MAGRPKAGSPVPPKELAALRLRESGLGYAEIARLTEKPMSTVANYVFRARVRLGLTPDRVTHCTRCGGRGHTRKRGSCPVTMPLTSAP